MARPGQSKTVGYRGHFGRMGFEEVLSDLEVAPRRRRQRRRPGGSRPARPPAACRLFRSPRRCAGRDATPVERTGRGHGSTDHRALGRSRCLPERHPRVPALRMEPRMKRSDDRILTTHAGSLPRPAELLQLVEGRDQRQVLAQPGAADKIDAAVRAVVERQVQTGIDVPSDGEMGRVGFSSYATERLTGFDGEPRPMLGQVERSMFPEFYAETRPARPRRHLANVQRPDHLARPRVHRARHRHASKPPSTATSPTEAFMPAVSPGQIWLNFQNEYYPSDKEYVLAAARALANEYRAIVDAGFVLQVDDPGLAMGWNRGQFADKSLDDYRRVVAGARRSDQRRAGGHSRGPRPPARVLGQRRMATRARRAARSDRRRAVRRTREARSTSKAPIRATATSGRSSNSIRCAMAWC